MRRGKKTQVSPGLNVGLASGIAALYAVGVVVLAPISFATYQIRVADALLPLSILFGWPAVLGLSLGCALANFFGGLGPIDVIGGSAANFAASFLAWKIGSASFPGSRIAAVIVQIIVVTLIVGGYLSYLFGLPLTLSLLGILVGSGIAIGILGYALLNILARVGIPGLPGR